MSIFKEDLLSGKTAFFSGGTSGINLAIAEHFARHGARVFLMSRSIEKVDAAVQRIERAGGEAAGATADVREYSAVERAVSNCVSKFGKIDIVLSGAAGNFVSPANALSSNAFKTVVDIDLVGSFNVMRACYEHLNKPGASILSISAVQALVAHVGQAHVCSAKAGIDMLTKTLAIEWGAEGIRVNSIAPGPVSDTEGMKRLTPTKDIEDLHMAGIPRGQYADKSDIAELALFLSSPAASNITGSVVVSDGGLTCLGSQSFADAWKAASKLTAVAAQ